jgi:hypothetical protein
LDEFTQILEFVQKAFDEGSTAQDVESGLWQRMLNLDRRVYQAWLELFGDGDAGQRIVLKDGREVRRLADLHRREIRNLFGLFELMRTVYGTREVQKIEAVPFDVRLQLPAEQDLPGICRQQPGIQPTTGGVAGAGGGLHPPRYRQGERESGISLVCFFPAIAQTEVPGSIRRHSLICRAQLFCLICS